MKKLSLLAVILSFNAWSVEIPLNVFEQSKLEELLRKIPSALQKRETLAGHVRKHYQFPTEKSSEFSIKCHADYFGTSQVPSLKVCEVLVSASNVVGDEYSFKLTDKKDVKALVKAISYGAEIKKVYSHERVYGQGHDGAYRQLFRYSFNCTSESCLVTFSPKKSTI